MTFINHFQAPWVLLALPLTIFLFLLHRRTERLQPTVLFSGLGDLQDLPRSFKQRTLALFPYTRWLALCLGIIALARPQYGTVEFSTSSLGVDIALAIDVSGSMQQDDYAPNRLEAAKAAAVEFVKNRKTDRVSVVVFAESAALLVPPTMDMPAVQQFIRAIQFNMINGQATAVGNGLALATSKLKDSPAKSRVVVLLTDGESNTGKIQPAQAAEIAKALNVKVYTIGLETNYGGMARFLNVPMAAPNRSFDDSQLRQIAETTGGRYFRASDTESLRNIYQEIDRLEKTELEVNETADYNERFMIFWFPALALLGFEFLLRALWLRRIP